MLPSYYCFVLFLLVIVIHWTRQIKELINSQESLESAETSGPLQEIEFWRARSEDLSGNNTHTHTHTLAVLFLTVNNIL